MKIDKKQEEQIKAIILEKEPELAKEILKIKGRYFFKEDPKVVTWIDAMGLDMACRMLRDVGHNQNSDQYRKMFRDYGYSLFGYWEIFYWEVNNPLAAEFRTPK